MCRVSGQLVAMVAFTLLQVLGLSHVSLCVSDVFVSGREKQRRGLEFGLRLKSTLLCDLDKSFNLTKPLFAFMLNKSKNTFLTE